MSQTHTTPIRARLWSPVEIELTGEDDYHNPFVDVDVTAHLHSPSGRTIEAHAFYYGDRTWLIRFMPDETGRWSFTTLASPEDPGLQTAGRVDVAKPEPGARGALRLAMEPPWNAAFADGGVPYLLGDTIFNLFGAAHCGVDVERVLRHRRGQGFRFFRVRVPVSPFHPPAARNPWQDRETWPWGGSPQYPLLDRFNLDYFATVDRVLELGLKLEVGFEIVLEAWMFEMPFNRRDLFTSELEALWLRYVVSRLAAYPSVYLWTLAAEYERYPSGEPIWNPLVDRWAADLAQRIHGWDPNGRPVAVDAVVETPAVKRRFQRFPEIGALCFRPAAQGQRKKTEGMAAAVDAHLTGSGKINMVAAPGFEDCPGLTAGGTVTTVSTDQLLTAAWTALFCGAHATVGFENTWGPYVDTEQDPPGAACFRHLAAFIDISPFPDLTPGPAPGLAPSQDRLMLRSEGTPFLAVYLPAGGACTLQRDWLPPAGQDPLRVWWLDVGSGTRREAGTSAADEGEPQWIEFSAPERGVGETVAAGWVLVLDGRESTR